MAKKKAEKAKETQVRIIFNEAGTEGLDIWGGFIGEAYNTKLYWPTVEPLYSRLRRSMPEIVMVRQAFTSWARKVRLVIELPDEPTDADKEYAEFIESVFDDVEGGQTKLLDTMVNHVPFMGWGLWEAVPGRRDPNWIPPTRKSPSGESYPDEWRSEQDDGLTGIRRFGFRAHNSFAGWVEQKGIKNVIGMTQQVAGQQPVNIMFKNALHLTYGDPNSPEGLSPLEAVWRLERIRYGLEVIQGIGFEHSAGFLSITRTEPGSTSITDKLMIKEAARAVLTAKEGNYAEFPYGLVGTVMDIPFQAAGSLLEAIKHYSILSLSVFMMQWVSLNTMTGTGSFAAMDDSSSMGVVTFNAMLDGFAAQIDEQIGRRLFAWNREYFGGLESRPKIKITHIDKAVALAEMSTFMQQLGPIMPFDDEDFKAVRERSGFLPTAVPEVDTTKTEAARQEQTELDREALKAKGDPGADEKPDEKDDKDLSEFHHGPGSHPGTGSSQDAHGGGSGGAPTKKKYKITSTSTKQGSKIKNVGAYWDAMKSSAQRKAGWATESHPNIRPDDYSYIADQEWMNLSKATRESIRAYGDGDYEEYNAFLRGESISMTPYLDEIEAMKEGAIPAPYDNTYYRGLNTARFAEVEVGDVIIDDGFFSASCNEETAYDFIGNNSDGTEGEVPTVFVVRVDKGFPIIFYNNDDDYPDEDEVIFLPGSALEVLSVTPDTWFFGDEGITVIELATTPPVEAKTKISGAQQLPLFPEAGYQYPLGG